MKEVVFSSSWQSPSNIALVKYWGKYGNQYPCNTSISFTLDRCRTETRLDLLPKQSSEKFSLEVFLNGERKNSFEPKILTFFDKISAELPWLEDYHFQVNTINTFPHSSGIASSASGMSALSLALCDLDENISGRAYSDFFREASRFSRIGSGSACRSVYGGLVLWGEHPGITGSSQEYAIPYQENIHPAFNDFCDTILLVHKGSKDVSSTAGHGLMNGHPFAKARFEEAQKNILRITDILKSGDLEAFTTLVESEALMLHGLMMSSIPYFILMKPNTLAIIEKIWEFRKQNGTPLVFTLDAGANVHLLYPHRDKEKVEKWIDEELCLFCENKAYICDAIGQGPQRLTT